jgi:lysozyme
MADDRQAQEEISTEGIPQEALNLIREHEGLRLNAYPDGPDRWSIGYGTESYEGEEITAEEAERRMLEYLRPLYHRIKHRCPGCSHSQKAALLSFAYNVGHGALFRSFLWELTLEGRIEEAALEFEKWTYHNGKHYRGLALRREAEREVYLNKGE